MFYEVFIGMKVKINDNTFNVKTLVDKESQSIGMMGKTFDESFDGLLFLMEGKKQCFWMKNCIIPLDIIIIKNNVIVNIHHNCPPCNDEFDCPSYCGNGNIVLEIEGGSCEILNIQAGDSITYDLS
jgi:uncharacterized membrane protein (UPF0127 family)